VRYPRVRVCKYVSKQPSKSVKIWFEIGGRKRDERIITYKNRKTGEQVQEWESGFGIGRDTEDLEGELWKPLEKMDSTQVYEILNNIRNELKNYEPNLAFKTIHKIRYNLTPAEREYWWKLIHKLTSIKQTESKYIKDNKGELISNKCPLCKTQKETRNHYNHECPKVLEFRKQIARIIYKETITNEEWMLQKSIDTASDTVIAKARWVYHCERCKIDHKSRRRINNNILLDTTIHRTDLALPKWKEFIKKTHENTKIKTKQIQQTKQIRT